MKVLIIDDDQDAITLATTSLALAGHEVFSACSGEEGVMVAAREHPGIILLDVAIPGESADGTLAELRNLPGSNTTVIALLTAIPRHLLQRTLAELGPAAVIEKPFDILALPGQVKALCPAVEPRSPPCPGKDMPVRKEEHQMATSLVADDYENGNQLAQLAQSERESLLQARAIFEHAEACIVLADRALNIIDANPAFQQRSGKDPSTLAGQSLLHVVQELPVDGLQEAIRAGKQFLAEGHLLPCLQVPGSDLPYFDISLWPVRVGESQPHSYVLTLTDVSERVRRLQLKEEFVATLTHDLKTPLAGADRMLELIASGGLCHIDEAGKKLIARLRHSNTKMLHLVQNLLETYRLESGVHWLHREEADLAALVRDCVEEMSPLADAAGLTLTCALEPTQANIDKASFYRVLANLMSNAIKFTPGGGAIEISGGTAGDAVVIRVRDTGRGIPQENSARIFQRFPRTDGKNGFQSSTGLGLYVCRQLVEAHGGTISFESEVGKGTTFTVKLPQAAQIASPEARHDAPQSTRRKNHDH